MTPFTRRLDPEWGRFLLGTCRALAVVAGLFCLAVSTLLVANAVQLAVHQPLDNPALAALREAYRQAPEDDELAGQIRALDLMARRAYFTRSWQLRAGAIMLAAGAAVLLVCLRGAVALSQRLPRPASAPPPGERWPQSGAVRRALGGVGLALLAAALVSALVGRGALARSEGPPGSAPGAAASSAADTGPELTTTAEYRANWPQFRGPGGNGAASPQEPPVDWDGESGRHILWKAQVPLPGFGSPVVWDERVFLPGADAGRRQLYCWDALDGELLWQAEVAADTGSQAGESGAPRISPDTGWAASTPAVNGRAVFAVYATGDLAAFTLDGQPLWQRRLGPPELNYGYASSLALYGDLLIVQFDQGESGRLLALEASSGRTRWETPRRVQPSWASPVVVDTGRRTEILVNGNPSLASYSPADGRELWQVGGMLGEIAPSPAYAGGIAFAANQLLSLIAVDVQSGEKLWEAYDDLPDVSSPVAAGELLITAASYGVVSCYEAATGTVLWKQEFDAGFYASPILAGGRVYLLDREGVMRILPAARDPQQASPVGSPAIGEPADATPAFRAGRIYIRGARHLFCAGEGDG